MKSKVSLYELKGKKEKQRVLGSRLIERVEITVRIGNLGKGYH